MTITRNRFFKTSLNTNLSKARRTRGRNVGARRLLCELLESRKLLAGLPSVTVDIPSQVMLGESVEVSVAFDNTHPSDPGFGPFIDVYLPRNGADGLASSPQDGLSFVSASANYLGSPVNTTVLVFPSGPGNVGTVAHPYAVDTSGNPLQVTGTSGDELLVFELPFGSFTAAQPAATITFEAQMSNLADLGTPLTVRARAGFRFGDDPLNNPATDPTTLSQTNPSANTWIPQSSVTPILVELDKTYIGPEDETATGPNFQRQYRIDINVADGQTITAVDVIESLPNNIQLVSIDTITPAGSVTTNPVTPANAPNNELVVTFPSITGTAADVDATVVFTYFVPFRDANADTVLSPISGDDVTAPINSRFVGDWTPLDPRDPSGTDNAVVDVAGPEHVLTPKSIATQKSVTLVNDIGGSGFSGGDTVEYSINFQVSDFFAFDAVSLFDVLSDGQRFDASFSPVLTVTEHGSTSTGSFDLSNFTVVDRFTGGTSPVAPLNGTQEVTFDVSGELVSRSLDSILLGGMVPAAGTGGADPNSATFNQGATTGQIVFRAIIQDNFTDDFPSADPSVDEGDLLENDVTISGAVLSFINVAATGQLEADTSSSEFVIAEGTLSKSIFAINGSTTLPSPVRLSPGDNVTYRIQLSLPSSDVEELRLEDFLPLPIFAATQVTTFSDVVSAAIPAAGTAKFGPGDTFRAIFGAAPVLSTDAVSNRVAFDYGDFDIDPSQPSNIDLLFTVTASDAPFADRLMLTNQVRRTQGSTNNASIANDAIVQIELGQPVLGISKGVIATNNSNASFTPIAAGPVGFSAPGTGGFRASGTVDSNGLASVPINSNISGVDAGDLVSFAIVVENTGSSRLGAFDIQLRDTIPAGFQIPTGGSGLNLTVTDGTGTVLAFSNIGSGLFDAVGGIELTDPGATTAAPDGTDGGALDEFDPSDGRNILIITYDLEVESTVAPAAALTNTATLFNYAGNEGGIDFTTEDISDDAVATVAPISVTKSIVSTNQAFTTGSSVAIGEIITYSTTITVPEGTAQNFVWTDTPAAGLSIIDIIGGTISPSLSTSVGLATAISNATISSASGGTATIDFGIVTNSDLDNSTSETITFNFRAIVLNNASTNRGNTLTNSANVTWTGGTSNNGTANVTVVEPTLQVAKTILPASGQGSETYTVTIDISHTAASNTTAFEVQLSDILPAGLTFVGGPPTSTGTAPATLIESSGTITASWDTFPVGSTSQIQFSVQSDPNVIPGTTITNIANSSWTSLPGDVSAAQTANAVSNERSGIVSQPGGAANDYLASGSDTVVIASPTVTKSLISTNQLHTAGSNVAIGEIATYEVVITVPQSSLPAASFLDTPDAGLAIVNVESVVASPDISTSIGGGFASVLAAANVSANANNGSSVLFDFGTISNTNTDPAATETITIRYRAVVLNSVVNNRGTVLDNAGEFRWNTSGVALVDGPDLTIVEPQLQVAVSNATPATADAGDTVSFTIDVSHAGVSDADAFEVTLQNLINSVPNHLQYVPGTINIVSAGGAAVTSSADAGGDLSGLWASFPLGATATITFDAIIQTTAPASTNLINSADVQWTSLPGDVLSVQSSNALSVERSGSSVNIGGTANDHLGSDSGFVTTAAATSTKSIISTSNPGTGISQLDPVHTDVTVGELVTYSIIAVMPEGTSTLVFTDQMPTGTTVLEFVSASVGTLGAQITAGAPTITVTNTDTDAFDDRVVIDFGSVVNAPNGVSDAGDLVEIIVVARVVDVPVNANAAVLTNTASIDVAGTVTNASAEVEVVEPELRIIKATSTTSGPPGSVVPYTITIDHAPGSTANAHDLALEDLLADLNLDLVAGSVSANRGTITSGNAIGSPADSTVALTLDTLALGEVLIVTFDALVNPSIGGATAVNNTSSLQYDNVPGIGGRIVNANDNETFTTTAPEIDLAVSVIDSEDATVIDNAGFFYTIVVTNNGPSTATLVQLVENLPPGVSNVVPSPSQGVASVTGGVMNADLGTLLPGQSATIIVTLTTPSTETTMLTDVSVSASETDINPANNIDEEPTIVLGVSSVSGRSWVDSNSNGVVDTNEILLPGVTVVLTGTDFSGAPVSLTTVTNLAGDYRFDFLRPGNYTLQQIQPTLFFDNNEFLGNGGGAIAANDTFQINLPAGVDVTDYFFTELGLRTELLSKRSLLNSRLRQGNGLTTSDFISLLAPRGAADLDGDGDIDNDDYGLFLTRLGGTF